MRLFRARAREVFSSGTNIPRVSPSSRNRTTATLTPWDRASTHSDSFTTDLDNVRFLGEQSPYRVVTGGYWRIGYPGDWDRRLACNSHWGASDRVAMCGVGPLLCENCKL